MKMRRLFTVTALILSLITVLSFTGCTVDLTGKWDIYCLEYGPSEDKYEEDLKEEYGEDYVNYLVFEGGNVTYNDNGRIYTGTYTVEGKEGIITLDGLADVKIFYKGGVLTVESSGGVWLIYHYKRAK